MFKKKSLKNTNDLPEELAIFPLSGVLLLPRGQLPLNIFENKYKAMIHDAFQNGRMIGMVQPKIDDNSGDSDIYMTGCAGRITHLEETGPDNYFITLTGVSRFDVVKEVTRHKPYRQVVPDWAPYEADLNLSDSPEFNEAYFLKTLKRYFDAMDMTCEKWDNLTDIHPEKLIATLAMVCPFNNEEKQALLEAPCLDTRVNLIVAMMEMASSCKLSDLKH